MPMTDEEYVKDKGLHCPWCKSDSVWDGEPLEFHPDGSHVFHPLKCDDCGKEWSSQYRLTGYTTDG